MIFGMEKGAPNAVEIELTSIRMRDIVRHIYFANTLINFKSNIMSIEKHRKISISAIKN